MVDKRADTNDTEMAYAVLKAGYRPFDCSRQATRREALANKAGAREPAKNRQCAAQPAEIVDLGLERSRRDPGRTDPIS